MTHIISSLSRGGLYVWEDAGAFKISWGSTNEAFERFHKANLAEREGVLGGQGNVLGLCSGAQGDQTVPCGDFFPIFMRDLSGKVVCILI